MLKAEAQDLYRATYTSPSSHTTNTVELFPMNEITFILAKS